MLEAHRGLPNALTPCVCPPCRVSLLIVTFSLCTLSCSSFPLQYLDGHDDLPESICEDLREYQLLKFRAREEHTEILQSFPPMFRSRIFRLLYKPIVSNTYMLLDAGDALIDVLATALSIELFQEGIPIVNQYETGLQLFFVITGEANEMFVKLELDPEDEPDEEETLATTLGALVARPKAGGGAAGAAAAGAGGGGGDDEDGKMKRLTADLDTMRKVDTIGPDDCIGEVSFIFDVAQPFTVVTASFCQVLVLTTESWHKICEDYPAEISSIEDRVYNFITKRKDLVEADGKHELLGVLKELVHQVDTVRAERALVRTGVRGHGSADTGGSESGFRFYILSERSSGARGSSGSLLLLDSCLLTATLASVSPLLSAEEGWGALRSRELRRREQHEAHPRWRLRCAARVVRRLVAVAKLQKE